MNYYILTYIIYVKFSINISVYKEWGLGALYEKKIAGNLACI